MNLNPFDLRGPEFLIFYGTVVAGAVFATWWRRKNEGGPEGNEVSIAMELAEDPYQLAFLRGGRFEVLHVALVSLLERGLLVGTGDCVRTEGRDAVKSARRPLDKAILTKYSEPTLGGRGKKAQLVYTDAIVLGEADLIGEQLEELGLLPSAAIKESRRNGVITTTLLLWFLAGIKIAVALSRGHSNMEFLILFAVFTPILLLLTMRRFRTGLGDRTLKQTQSLFTYLRERRNTFDPATGGTGSELAFLAAAFGLAALPPAMGTTMESLALKPPKTVNSMSGGCGSSCAGASCGSGGGCGGGGGGCGGGGCGGCGS